MPIYEYVCKACGEATEIIHKISDPPERKCPACGKLKLTKLVSAAAFRLKGGGWYETDFKSGDKKNLVTEAKEDKPGAETPAAKDAPKTSKDKKDAKPAEPAKPAKKESAPAAKTATTKKTSKPRK